MRKLILTLVILGWCSVAYGAWKFNPYTNKLDLHDVRFPKPTNPTDACSTGDISMASGYIYVCVADNTWQRAAIATWATTNTYLLKEDSGFLLQENGDKLILEL